MARIAGGIPWIREGHHVRHESKDLQICGVREMSSLTADDIEREVMSPDTLSDAFVILVSPDGHFVQCAGYAKVGI